MVEYINGKVFRNGKLEKKNFLIKNGKLFFNYEESGAKKVDISHLVVSPAFVDVHVHTRVPGQEYKEDIKHINEAALFGGFTTMVAMGNTNPRPEDVETWKKIQDMQNEGVVNIIQCANVTKNDKLINEIPELSKYTNIFTDDGAPIVKSEVMKQALVKMKEVDGVIMLHEQDPEIKGVMYEGKYALANNLPCFGPEYETNWTIRDAELNRGINAKMHYQHISAKGTVAVLKKCKQEGIVVTAELTPHHLWFSTDDIDGNTSFKMNPPLANPENRAALINAYIDGTIDIIATDHAPHSAEDKSGGFMKSSFGIIGLETSFAAVHTQFHKLMPIEKILSSFTTNPARLISVDVAIKDGEKANITFLDLNKEWTFTKNDIKSKSHNTPFLNKQFKGKVVKTIYGTHERGQI